MIASLTGFVQEKKPDMVIVNVHGVGYLLQIPLSTFYKLPAAGDSCTMAVHTHVREDQISLFGFHTGLELDIFKALISVTGFGPKKALTVLSGMEPEQITQCITAGDITGLSGIPGVGRKTAERLVLELREKLHKYLPAGQPDETPRQAGALPPAELDDLISALVNLGYGKPQAEKAVFQVSREHPGEPFEKLLRISLKFLMAK